ncbi:MAG: ferrochelatase [Alphaproteobacteria bacterium]|nr:ferrochelatase [Alphaproteobacteria bacterium]
MTTAVVLYNLGGPDKTEAIRPFLFNLFNDPMILGIPQPFRWLLAQLISRRRASTAGKIYAHLGGSSPLLKNTLDQADALEVVLNSGSNETYKCFVAMRYWHPFCLETLDEVLGFQPDQIVLLPLYPQFSVTTVGSMMRVWEQAAKTRGLKIPVTALCCYPTDPGFVSAVASFVSNAVATLPAGEKFRVLFSAHGLPKKIVAGGDPYQWQVEQTTKAVVAALDQDFDWINCYQSRVGPLEWIGPATEDEIRLAGAEGISLVVVPIAFVSEHSETLVELDIEYREIADHAGVRTYLRTPTVGVNPMFIEGLAKLVRDSAAAGCDLCSGTGERVCTLDWSQCPMKIEA